MKTVTILFVILNFAITESTLIAQGTFIYDQQSATTPDVDYDGADIPGFSIGQSFTPQLNAVDFIQLEMASLQQPSEGAVIDVILHSDSITGPILATSQTASLAPGSASNPMFYFSSSIPVTPGTTYFLEAVSLSGTGYIVVASEAYNYAGGSMMFNDTPNPNYDLWFREGIVAVPEPSTWTLAACAAGLASIVRWKRCKSPAA